jgi:hypothetical protein
VRIVALWAVLFAVYASAIGIEASGGSEYGGDEPHYLLIAESIVSDGDLDVTDEYAESAYVDWFPDELDTNARPTDGALHEPQGAGFPVLIAPAYALGGARAVELFAAALAAPGFALAALLARRIVPEPYASAGAALVGLSPPAIAHATAVYPELTAGTLLTGAALCAVSARERPRVATVLGGAAMLALLPWLGVKYVVPALPVAFALATWPAQHRRRLLGIISAELIVGSLVFYATLNERLYGGPTPYSAALPGTAPLEAETPGEYLDRVPRLVALWLDRNYGLLRWAPVLALAFFAAWLLWRSRREQLARVISAQATTEAAAGLALAICGAQALVAAFAVPTMYGDWFPGRQLAAALPAAGAICGWGLRHAPRAGAALGALTLATSAWLLIVRDPWGPPATAAPWGPLETVFPDYRTATGWAIAVAAIAVAALLIAIARGTSARGSAIGRMSRAAPGRRR